MKLPFGEIKRDIRMGFSYREYEVDWHGAPVTAILDQPNNEVIYCFTDWANQQNDPCADFRYLRLDIDSFLAMKFRELNDLAAYCCFH